MIVNSNSIVIFHTYSKYVAVVLYTYKLIKIINMRNFTELKKVVQIKSNVLNEFKSFPPQQKRKKEVSHHIEPALK